MNELCKMCAYEHSDCKGNKEYTSFKCDYYKKPQVFNAKQAAERIAELRWLLDDTLDKYFSLMGRTMWRPLSHIDAGLGTDFPYERDGEWVIVTDGKTISVERIKKDCYDHFYPNGRWFELEDVVAWMPLPEPYKDGDTND